MTLVRTAMMSGVHPTWSRSFKERAQLSGTPALATYLLHLIALKKSNLCLSADVESSSELLKLAEETGDSICLLKTHADIISDWSDSTARKLKSIAKKKRFLVFEDRKFGDIGSKSATMNSHTFSLIADEDYLRHGPEAVHIRAA